MITDCDYKRVHRGKMTVKTIAVLGAGHGGCAAAADLTRRGFAVRLHARRAESLAPLRARGGIEARGVQQGLVPIAAMTTDVAEALDGADLIMLVVPSVAHEHYARALAPLIDGSKPIFLNPGHTGGGLHFLHELRQAGYRGPVQSCETVTLTYITRMEGPATVGIYSYTKRLRFAALPGKHADKLFALMKPIYPEIVQAGSVIETALGNMNAVFHPPGMLMNAGWIESTNGNFLFYKEGITEAVGRVTAEVDAERMAVAKALGVPATSFLDPVLRRRPHHRGGARQRQYLARLRGERAEQDHQVAAVARPPLYARGRWLRACAVRGARPACRGSDADHRCARSPERARARHRLCTRRADAGKARPGGQVARARS